MIDLLEHVEGFIKRAAIKRSDPALYFSSFFYHHAYVYLQHSCRMSQILAHGLDKKAHAPAERAVFVVERLV